MFEPRERQNSAYRSVRYSTIRKQSFTADVDRLSLNRLKKKPQLESTFYNTRTIQLKPHTSDAFNNPERTSYLESFHSMLHSEKRVKDADEDQFKANQLNIKFTNFDHNFAKQDSTQFTLLDPFNRPYSYLTRELNKTDKQLKSQQEDLKLIKSQLAIMKHTLISSLRTTEQDAKVQFQRLRNALKKNETAEQERKMRVRRQMTTLYEQHDNNNKLGQQILSRARGMQIDIFDCEPFQLVVEPTGFQ